MAEIITNLVNEFANRSKKKDYWSGSVFEPLLAIGSDERGELGEKIIYEIFSKYTKFKVSWDGNKNIARKDGSIWDILVNIFTNEVKTAMRGSTSATWQHEKIVEANCWDKIIFIDIDYSSIWFTVQNHSQIPFNDSKHEILGKKSTYHLGGWKFDLSLRQLKILEKEGYSFEYQMDGSNLDELIAFLIRHFS